MIARMSEDVYRSYTSTMPFYIRELGRKGFWLSVGVPGMSLLEP